MNITLHKKKEDLKKMKLLLEFISDNYSLYILDGTKLSQIAISDFEEITDIITRQGEKCANDVIKSLKVKDQAMADLFDLSSEYEATVELEWEQSGYDQPATEKYNNAKILTNLIEKATN
jgi:hypothetical protein